MTISPAEFDRRFADHVLSARQAGGKVVCKSAGYYGEGLESEETRERIKMACRTQGIGGQFIAMATSSLTGLRLWERRERDGTE
ncbi:MAG: hypothetical protein KF841_14240 [Phycisphaerae bacterium]|nr:hypothetical protein [Phycisphaerae bacterium]